jgi:hypothetical protein
VCPKQQPAETRPSWGLAGHQPGAEAVIASGAGETAAVPPAVPERTLPLGLRDQGPRHSQAAPERASQPRGPAPSGLLPPATRQLFREPWA